jgi:hypothetical protein
VSAADKRTIAVVTACLRSDGKPTFARTEVSVTPDEAENGVHYYLVEGELLLNGYEEPMVHFSKEESPPFLFPAVQQFLSVASATPEPSQLVLVEGA